MPCSSNVDGTLPLMVCGCGHDHVATSPMSSWHCCCSFFTGQVCTHTTTTRNDVHARETHHRQPSPTSHALHTVMRDGQQPATRATPRCPTTQPMEHATRSGTPIGRARNQHASKPSTGGAAIGIHPHPTTRPQADPHLHTLRPTTAEAHEMQRLEDSLDTPLHARPRPRPAPAHTRRWDAPVHASHTLVTQGRGSAHCMAAGQHGCLQP